MHHRRADGDAAALGHKGKFAGCISCRGQAAHSANPGLGCNAIYLAADMVQELRALQDWLMAHGARDAAYEVPYSTVHVGTIAGGTALNIVPERCDVAFEFRLLADDSANALLARLRAAGERLAAAAQGRRALVEIVEANRYPGLETAAESEIARLVMAAGAGPAFKAGFGSEAGCLTKSGWSRWCAGQARSTGRIRRMSLLRGTSWRRAGCFWIGWWRRA